jgi:hypothetical protein
LLLAAGVAAATLQSAYSQNVSTSRRDPDTELFFRHTWPESPHYARADRFEQQFETHRSPGEYSNQDTLMKQ